MFPDHPFFLPGRWLGLWPPEGGGGTLPLEACLHFRNLPLAPLLTTEALSPDVSAQAEKLSCKVNSADTDHVSGFSFVGADLRERPWGTTENAKIPLAILLSIVVAAPLGCGGVRTRGSGDSRFDRAYARPGEARSRDDLESFVLCRGGLSEFEGSRRPAGGMVQRAPEPRVGVGISRTFAQVGAGKRGPVMGACHRAVSRRGGLRVNRVEGPGVIGQRAQEAHNAAVKRLY